MSPNITLFPLWEGESGASEVSLICIISDYSPNTVLVEWQKNQEAIPHIQQTVRELQSVSTPTTFTQNNEIKINKRDWESGLSFTCKVTHNKEEFNESISICKIHGTTRPFVQVKIPTFKTITATSEVEAKCFVQSVFKATVTWQVDGKSWQKVKHEQNQTHITSTMNASLAEWKTLQRLTCKAEHPCFSSYETNVTVQGPAVTPPKANISRSLSGLQKEEVVLLCDVTGLSSGDLYITFQNDTNDISEKMYVYLPEAPELHSVSRKFSVPRSSWVKGTKFSCTVTQGFSNIVRSESVSFVVDPSVDVFVLSKESGSQTLVCSGSGFNPQIQWLPGSGKMPPSTNSRSMDASGVVTVTNQHQIPQTEWKTGKSFTCEVSDKSLMKKATKEISFCSVTPASSQLVYVYVQGPGGEELPKGEQVTITCLLVGFELKDFSVTWKVNGHNRHENIHTKQPVSHSNGTETLQSFLNISAKDWEAFMEVSCEGKHICSQRIYKDQIRKNKVSVIYSEPSVTLLHGPNELVCLATGFSPPSINITWFVENSTKPVNYSTTEPHAGNNGAFSVQSHLNLTGFTWLLGKVITCNVTHENATFSLSVTKPDTLEKCLFLDEILQVEVYQDISVDSWYTTVTFLLLFLTAVFYSLGVTLVKTN